MRSAFAVLVLVGLAIPTHAEGDDFGAQAQLLFRVGACGGEAAVPDRFPAKTIAAHCKSMDRLYASYRRMWADRARSFIQPLFPAGAPKKVVYPFGGGDLTSALVVFPDATEITTLSLEAPGDVRAIDTITKTQLVIDLDTISHDIKRLYRAAHSTTKSLQAAAYSELPGSLMFALAGLAVNGFEPVSLRYFDIAEDGTLIYLTGAELDRRVAAVIDVPNVKSGVKSKKRYDVRRHKWVEMESVFSNVEIQFRPRGVSNAPLRTYRHILVNLDDTHMSKDDRVLDHLRAKGKVSVMTKAASFLLWFDEFSQVRTYLVDHLAWMLSDASGLPPKVAKAAHLEQTTYGSFVGPYFIQDPRNTRTDMVKLWSSQPERKLPFRFGYPDA